MSEPRNPALHVGRMRLRIPGTSAEYGRGVAAGVGSRLAEQLPPGLEKRLGVLKVRVPAPPGAGQAEMSAAIADAVARALWRSGHA